jgi:hypothetical protein
MNEINKESQSRYSRCPEVRSSLLAVKSRLCAGVKILKHHLRSRLHLLVAYGFQLIEGVSHNIEH